MEVAILLAEGSAAVEALAPAIVLGRLPGAVVRFVAAEPGPHQLHEPALLVEANHGLGAVRAPEVLVVPGGFGVDRLLADDAVVEWVRVASSTARCVVGASTGSLVLGAAGLLAGRDATAHWLTLARLPAWGAHPVAGRPVVRAGRVVTTAGGAGALEAALVACEVLAGPDVARAIRSELRDDPNAFDVATAPGVIHREQRGQRRGPFRRRRGRHRRVVTLLPPPLT